MRERNNVLYNIKTEYGIFNVKFRISLEKEDNPIEFTVSIGSIDKKCIQLTVPILETGETNAKLLWVELYI